MKLSHVAFTSSDKLHLPGLLYQPERATKRAAVWLHGMGDNGVFYNPQFYNPLGEALAGKGIALLAFNNRGAHNRKSLRVMDEALPEDQQRVVGGTHYERIADCVHDIDGAVAYLREQGFREFYLLGHSTGANKICAYHVRAKHNPFTKYVLAGPGDDSGIWYTQLGDKKFWRAIRYAETAIKAGEPEKVLPRYTGMHPFSAQAALDILHPDGAYNTFPFYEATHKRLGKKPLFQEFRQLDRPSLIIFGEQDQYAFTAGSTAAALGLFKQHTNPRVASRCAYQLVPEADHAFHWQEPAFATAVATWLAKP